MLETSSKQKSLICLNFTVGISKIGILILTLSWDPKHNVR